MYRRWNYLRTVNPHLTTMIAIGGWNEGSDKYSKMASSAASRKIFVDSVVKFLKKYDFDGIDLDWFAIFFK
jgi:chitinase